MRNRRKKLLDWLGLKSEPDYFASIKFGRFLGFCLIALGFIYVVIAVGVIWSLASVVLGTATPGSENVRDYGLVFAALIGAPFVIWRTIVAAKQADIADESLFNEKFNVAATALGARRKVDISNGEESWEDDLIERLNSIDRLESLADERQDAAPRVVKMLAAYVRVNFPQTNLDFTELPFEKRAARADLQATVDAIGRLLKIARQVDPSEWRLNLRNSNFDGVRFSRGYFFAVDFTSSRFESAEFVECSFEGAQLCKCLLNFAVFRDVNLIGANFNHCAINRPVMHPGSIHNPFLKVEFKGTQFIGADISAVNYLGQADEISNLIGSADTKLSFDFKGDMPSLDDMRRCFGYTYAGLTPPNNMMDKCRIVLASGFGNWIPYDSNDGAVGDSILKIYKRLGLRKWPYVDLLKRYR